MADASVPIIDIAPFLAGGAEGKARVAAELDTACRDIGFLVIAGHGVAEEKTEKMRALALGEAPRQDAAGPLPWVHGRRQRRCGL